MKKHHVQGDLKITLANDLELTKNNGARTENWKELAAILQEKAMKRLDDFSILVSRANLMIVAIAFLVPSILDNTINTESFLLEAIIIFASFICLALSLFSTITTPIDPNESIMFLESEQFCNMSQEVFYRWKADSYRVALNAFDKKYTVLRRLQIVSFVLLCAAILLLFTLKYVIIDITIGV